MFKKIVPKLKKLLRAILLSWVAIGFISTVLWVVLGIIIVVNYIITIATH